MKPYYYVYKLDGGMPRVRHEMITDAQIEAERLAALEPDECFEILMCVGQAMTSRTRTFWHDGIDPDSLV